MDQGSRRPGNCVVCCLSRCPARGLEQEHRAGRVVGVSFVIVLGLGCGTGSANAAGYGLTDLKQGTFRNPIISPPAGWAACKWTSAKPLHRRGPWSMVCSR